MPIRFIQPILLITGLITVLPLLKFLFPDLGFPPGVTVTEETGRFLVRHQALEIACIGGLLVCAAFNAAMRVPMLIAAIIGKGGIVYLILQQGGNPAFAVMQGTLIFDIVCVVLYALCLVPLLRKTDAA